MTLITRKPDGKKRMIHEITISKQVRSRNELDKMHWSTRHRETKDWEMLIRLEGFKGKVPKATTRMGITILSYRKARIKDDANLRGGCKPIIDALKRLGAIVEDSDEWIDDEYVQAVDRNPRTVIRLTTKEAENGAV